MVFLCLNNTLCMSFFSRARFWQRAGCVIINFFDFNNNKEMRSICPFWTGALLPVSAILIREMGSVCLACVCVCRAEDCFGRPPILEKANGIGHWSFDSYRTLTPLAQLQHIPADPLKRALRYLEKLSDMTGPCNSIFAY